ncbi:hypothetical protein Tco_0853493 [Tanacetum coccineum]
MHQSMAPARMSSGPEPFMMTPGQLNSGLAPTDKELEMLFQPMFDEHFKQTRVNEPVPSTTEINAQGDPQVQSLRTPIPEDPTIIHDVLHPSHNLATGDPGSAQSSSGNVNSPDHLRRWTKDHPLDNIVGNPSRPRPAEYSLPSGGNQEHDHLPDGCQTCFSNVDLQKKSLAVQPKDLKTRKTYSRLSSKKALYRLKQAPRAWTNKVSQSSQRHLINQGEICTQNLKNYGMISLTTVDTPMVDRLKLDENSWGFR